MVFILVIAVAICLLVLITWYKNCKSCKKSSNAGTIKPNNSYTRGGNKILIDSSHELWDRAKNIKNALNVHSEISDEQILEKVSNKSELLVIFCLPSQPNCKTYKSLGAKMLGIMIRDSSELEVCPSAVELMDRLDKLGYSNLIYVQDNIENWRIVLDSTE